MTELISKSAAINTTFNMCCRWDGEDRDDLRNMMLTAFQELPTVDAVPVVRCKDCKYRPIDTGTHQYGHELEFPNEYKCPCQCGDNWYSWMPDGEWFCANGERRTDEQT